MARRAFFFHRRASHILALVATAIALSSPYTHAQSRGPGPRAGHCIVEHGNVLYFLGGTPPLSSNYAPFTSLKLPLNSISTLDPETLPWLDLPNPPVPVQIVNMTMTFSTSEPRASPSWIDCFATDDGRIVVVGGSFQVLVYNIATASWSDAINLRYGPSVSSGMFLNPVYLQSRILADGVALVVCTLNWNSQPQPYYLNTNTWMVTLAIGTPETTPVASSASSNGWGTVPGGGPLLPPAGLRHFTLAILGQDKNDPKNHYGNGRAFILGGYSSLVTGLVQDWDVLTSFPVQQAPSNVVVMFGNAGKLPKATRGSVAYPVSPSLLDIFPGNAGGSSTQQQVQVYDINKNAVEVLSGISGGPKNTIFRAATVIGQGQQIFFHGGLTSLEISTPSPPTNLLDQSIGVWNGGSQQWGDTVDVYVPPAKSKTLMIGLIIGGIVLLIIMCLGLWYFIRRRRHRLLEEEERQAKGMALKNEDMLQKDHKSRRSGNSSDYNSSSTAPAATYFPQGGHQNTERDVYQPLQLRTPLYADGYEMARSTSMEIMEKSPYPSAEAELIDDESDGPFSEKRRTVQEYPSTSSFNTMHPDRTQHGPSYSPVQYQAVVHTVTQPIYGQPSYGIAKEEYNDIEPAAADTLHRSPSVVEYQGDIRHLQNLRASLDGKAPASQSSAPASKNQALFRELATRASKESERSSVNEQPSRSSVLRESYFATRPYSSSSSLSFNPTTASSHLHVAQRSPYMSSPSFSTSLSVPDSVQGSDSAHSPLAQSELTTGDLMVEESVEVFHVPSSFPVTVGVNPIKEPPPRSPPAIPLNTRPQI
ncbi:hypothetical protein BGZ68_009759 [Mortierella alpina]|nr:hypothetical protein BGZ68_009759 [Mortierella alpina]